MRRLLSYAKMIPILYLLTLVLCIPTYGYKINGVGDDVIFGKRQTQQTLLEIKTDRIGNHQVSITAHEIPFRETLPYNVVSKDYFPTTTKTITTKVDNTAPTALYTTHGLSKVDIVFAIGNTCQAELLQSYIPIFTSKVSAAENFIDARVEQIKTAQVDMQKEFKWEKDISSSIGSLSLTNNGRTVEMRGNRSNAGKNAIYILSDQSLLKQEFSFSYSMSFGDSFSAAGVFLNIGKVGNQLQGYAIGFPHSSGTFSQVGVYEVTYTLNNHSRQFEYTKLIQSLPISNSGNLSVEIYEDTMYVWGGGISQANRKEINLPRHYGFGIGFFSEHYSHGCDNIGYFSLNNLNLQKTEAKNLGSSLEDISWREDSTHVIIHVTDVIPRELSGDSDDSDYLTTLTKLMSNNAYLLNLGTTTNQQALIDLGKKLTGTDGSDRSHFINNYCNCTVNGTKYNNINVGSKDVRTSLDQAITWIKSLIDVDDEIVLEKWLLVNERMIWSTEYHDSEHDVPMNFNSDDLTKNSISSWAPPLTAKFTDSKKLAEKWRFKHFKSYYDQSFVDADFNNEWIPDPVESFSLPGKYRVNYKRLDNPFYEDVSINSAFNEYRKWSTWYDGRISDSDEPTA